MDLVDWGRRRRWWWRFLGYSWIENVRCFGCTIIPNCPTNIYVDIMSNIHVTTLLSYLNTLNPRQNGRHFADDTFKCIFVNENVWISITIWLGFVPKDPINNIQALVQIMAWRRPGDKPLSEPMMISLPTHICVTRPQWVKKIWVETL